MRVYPWRHRLHRSKERKRWYVRLFCLATVGLFLLRLDGKLRPAIIEITASELETAVTETVDQACLREADGGKDVYQDLVHLQYDEEGNLLGLTTDMAAMNRLRAELTGSVEQQLQAAEQSAIRVPLGTASGVTLFSGLGPAIPVQILHLESISSQFESSFTAAGINQTRHRIELVLSVEVVLLLPGSSCNKIFTNRITVAESILMGDIPSHYSYFSQYDTAREAADAQQDYSAE